MTCKESLEKKQGNIINSQVLALGKSATLSLTALTNKLIKEGKDVVNFTAGEPDFDTPDFIKEAAKKAIDEGFTKYTPSTGTLELREAIAKKLKEENNIAVDASGIIVTAGAKYSLYVAILGLVGQNDEVLLPAPYWVSYPEMVKLTQGKLKIIPTEKKNNFVISVETLKKAITSKTKLLILNYPNNPTGMTYSREDIEAIYDVIKDKNIFVLSDEIYEKLIYDGRKHVSFASLPNAKDITLTVNGFSKAFSMTGWRLGYLAGPTSIINELSKIVDHTTSCSTSISQKAALAALKDKDWQANLNKQFQERRDVLWQGLSKLKKIKPFKSQGTFYMLCDISDTGLSGVDFASKLLNDYMVSSIPAESFGIEGCIRISFATNLEQINKGIERISAFLNK